MQIKLPKNKLCDNEQDINFESVTALIGENGAGKSSILQSIFQNRLQNNCVPEMKVVCFSSGQNEKYSAYFSSYLAKERQANRGLRLDCCYYDKTWSKLLIFIATITKEQGKVRSFLLKNDYITISENGKEDLTSTLKVTVQVNQAYVNRVQMALKKQAEGDTDTLRDSAYHRTLESFINTIVDSDYDFEHPLEARTITLSNNNFSNPSFKEADDEFFDSVITFFTQAADNDYFIVKPSMELIFKEGIELNDVSDGEYQLLFLYALIDLFDSKDTLFLLDEVDSHLHYKNIENLWETLHKIEGNAWTTTHLLDSITFPKHRIENLKVVERGLIQENNKVKAIIDRLSVLSWMESVQFDIYSKFEHIVLMDHYNDWKIFRLLATRKGLDTDKLLSIQLFEKSSGYSSITEEFGKAKFDWVSSFLSHKPRDSRATRVIFLICDKDEAALEIDHQTGVIVRGENFKKQIKTLETNNNIKIYLLAWRRREIKNYLLSYTALTKHKILEKVNNGRLGLDYHLTKNEPGDNDGIRRLEVKDYMTKLIDTTGVGLDAEKLQSYINEIPPREISADIVNMYNFLVGKCDGK